MHFYPIGDLASSSQDSESGLSFDSFLPLSRVELMWSLAHQLEH